MTERGKQKAKADREFSKIVRSIGFCQASTWQDGVTCGGYLQCAHIIGRANHTLRWDPINALSLCGGHHIWYTNHPFEWWERIQEHYPSRYQYLRGKQQQRWDRDYDHVFARLDDYKHVMEGVTFDDLASGDFVYDKCGPDSEPR